MNTSAVNKLKFSKYRTRETQVKWEEYFAEYKNKNDWQNYKHDKQHWKPVWEKGR